MKMDYIDLISDQYKRGMLQHSSEVCDECGREAAWCFGIDDYPIYRSRGYHQCYVIGLTDGIQEDQNEQSKKYCIDCNAIKYLKEKK